MRYLYIVSNHRSVSHPGIVELVDCKSRARLWKIGRESVNHQIITKHWEVTDAPL